MLTLQEVLPYFNDRKATLADALGISRQAINNWKLDEAIPEKHELKIRHELLPDIQKNTSASAPAAKSEMKFTKSNNLDHVLYDIRGPVLIEAQRLEDEGNRILKLNVGNPGEFDLHAPVEIMQDVIRNLNSAEGYCDSRGLFSARKAVMQECQINGIPDVGMNDIYMGNGVSELIVMCTQALMENGDEILVPAPDYPLWTAASNLSGGRAVHYTCDESADWQPDLDDIRSKITPKTKAIVVINPNNPTGAVYERDVLEGIAKIAVEHNLVIFADEIYDKILYDEAQHIPMASITDETLVITFNGLSKSYRLAGFRCGWMVISGAKRKAKSYLDGLYMLSTMRLCANVPGQLAVQTALGGYQSINDLVIPGGRLREQRDAAYDLLNDIPGVSCVKPKGALYLFPKLDPKMYPIEDDEKFVLELLRAKHLLVIQGTGFNWKQPDHVRMVFLPTKSIMTEAINNFADFLDKYQP